MDQKRAENRPKKGPKLGRFLFDEKPASPVLAGLPEFVGIPTIGPVPGGPGAGPLAVAVGPR